MTMQRHLDMMCRLGKSLKFRLIKVNVLAIIIIREENFILYNFIIFLKGGANSFH